MKIIHCADVHLGSSLTTHLDAQKAKERQGELLATFTNMLDYGEKNNVNAIIIAGDLFDKDEGIKTIKKSVFKAIKSHPNIQFFYLKGNHDSKTTVETLPENLYCFDSNWKTYAVCGSERIKITGAELTENNTNYIFNSLNLDPSDFNIVTLHGQESKYDSKNDAEVINITDLKNKGIDYLALGHIHKYKEEKLDSRGKYCYSGCLEGRGFDEPGNHGFVLLDIDEDKLLYSSRFVHFAKRKVFHEEVDISNANDTFEIASILKEHIGQMNCSNKDYAEFVLIGDVTLDSDIDEDFISKQIEDEFYFVKIKNKTDIAIDYSQFEMDESLKGEFVRLVNSRKDLDEKEKSKIIKIGINALSGKEI